MRKLFVVPTPIGNLQDITLRAITVLKEVDLILAEDTRTSSVLLKHFDIQNKLQSYHKFNEHQQLEHYINLLDSGQSIALISDAGTPAISDPGFLLVRECKKNNIDVETLPGATAFVPALVNSGLPNDRFVFEGFLPVKKGRQKRIKALLEEERTMIFYESPYRLVKFLEQLSQAFGEDREASVSREISKLYEENKRGRLSELIEHFKSKTVKGEIVVIVAGKSN